MFCDSSKPETNHQPQSGSQSGSQSDSMIDRRSFLGIGAATLGGVLLPSLATSAQAANFRSGIISKGARRLVFRNTHTGESFSGVYRVGDKYLPDAFDQINTVMRDFRTDQRYPMDPRVLDIIYSVQRMSNPNKPLEIISGYRSPGTNKMLRNTSSGVAKKSLHMKGQAIDFRMKDFSTKRLRDIAKNLRAGGVGYYSKSDFVHVDTGDVRSWGS
ncbi:MAG: DUF882 domain-containing protein [Alphaproteobacteria bacterium]|nr:DUF882 domain-containing protein [Alphaproteobacteria bacterium]